ncbi:chemotaxis protein CheB [Acetobacter orientalis]|uniref:Chemotaxis protein CheB n=1 Tax=Acetobacter orientalis TaxID=146474 RepID=A0A2Z5ZFT9_9PROT|nr:chemotaxis protein CheB [Acetobacter orientalis]
MRQTAPQNTQRSSQPTAHAEHGSPQITLTFFFYRPVLAPCFVITSAHIAPLRPLIIKPNTLGHTAFYNGAPLKTF